MIYLLIYLFLGFIAAGWIKTEYERIYDDKVAMYRSIHEDLLKFVKRVSARRNNYIMLVTILLGIVTFILGLLICIERKSFTWQFPFRRV